MKYFYLTAMAVLLTFGCANNNPAQTDSALADIRRKAKRSMIFR